MPSSQVTHTERRAMVSAASGQRPAARAWAAGARRWSRSSPRPCVRGHVDCRVDEDVVLLVAGADGERGAGAGLQAGRPLRGLRTELRVHGDLARAGEVPAGAHDVPGTGAFNSEDVGAVQVAPPTMDEVTPGPGRFHLTACCAGQPVAHGWWNERAIADRKFAGWVGEYGACKISGSSSWTGRAAARAVGRRFGFRRGAAGRRRGTAGHGRPRPPRRRRRRLSAHRSP